MPGTQVSTALCDNWSGHQGGGVPSNLSAISVWSILKSSDMAVLASAPIFSPAHWKARSNFFAIFMAADCPRNRDQLVSGGGKKSQKFDSFCSVAGVSFWRPGGKLPTQTDPGAPTSRICGGGWLVALRCLNRHRVTFLNATMDNRSWS